MPINKQSVNFKATREQLKKIQLRLEEYRAALRLAGIEMEQRNRDMIALTHFAYQTTHMANPSALLQLALTRALDATNAQVGGIVLIDSETRELRLGAHIGLTKELAQILTGQRWAGGAIALMPHLVAGVGALLEGETDEETERLLLDAGRLDSLASLPLKVAARLLGALVVGLKDQQRFKSADLCFLMALSQETAIAVDSLRLREGLWYTAETLLGHQVVSFNKWQPGEQEVVELEPPAQFDLPSATSPLPAPVEDDLEQVWATVIEAENEMQQQNADLLALNTIADLMNRTLDLNELLQCAVDQTQAILRADAAWVYLIDEKKQLEMRAHVGLSAAYIRGMHRLELGDGLEGWVAAKNKARFVESIAGDAYDYKIWVDKEGLQTLAAVPITRPELEKRAGSSGSLVVGVLVAGRRTGHVSPWSGREVRLVTSIANQLAPTIDNARLYAEVREDEASLRAGNQVLQEINEMLIQKNVFLEEFIHRDLEPMLATSMRVLQQLLIADSPLSDEQTQEVMNLQKIIKQLNDMTRQVLTG